MHPSPINFLPPYHLHGMYCTVSSYKLYEKQFCMVDSLRFHFKSFRLLDNNNNYMYVHQWYLELGLFCNIALP